MQNEHALRERRSQDAQPEGGASYETSFPKESANGRLFFPIVLMLSTIGFLATDIYLPSLPSIR